MLEKFLDCFERRFTTAADFSRLLLDAIAARCFAILHVTCVNVGDFIPRCVEVNVTEMALIVADQSTQVSQQGFPGFELLVTNETLEWLEMVDFLSIGSVNL